MLWCSRVERVASKASSKEGAELIFVSPSFLVLTELWNAFHEMDRNHDGRLDVGDMSAALGKAG